MNLRALRLWHWRQLMHHRNAVKLARYYMQPLRDGNNLVLTIPHDFQADFHLHCVQMLNSYAECEGTTAEQDDEENYAP